MTREKAFACPSCRAPYRALIPSGTAQVKCIYCGATVLVPPDLGGMTHRCPNHPNLLAVGLCHDCSQSYCGHCLYIYEVKSAKLHVCEVQTTEVKVDQDELQEFLWVDPARL